MKVFLDTNVLVSGLTTRGLCSDVLQLATAEHEVIVGEVVLTEVRRILTRKFKIPEERVEAFVGFLSEFHIEPTPHPLPPIPIRDPNDVAVLGCAIAAGADVIVSGDKDLLELPVGTSPVPIINPRAFWTRYRPTQS